MKSKWTFRGVFLICCLLLWSSIYADTLTTLNGTQEGAIASWPEQGDIPLEGGGSLARHDFISWKSSHVSRAFDGQIQMILTNGASLRGKVLQWTEEGIEFESLFVKKSEYSYDQIWALLFLDQVSSAPLQERLLTRLYKTQAGEDDVLFLKSDQIDGVLDSVEGQKVFFDMNGEMKEFNYSDVYAVMFPNQLNQPNNGLFLTLRSGDHFPASGLKWDKKIELKTSVGSISLNTEDIAQFVYKNPRHQFLGDHTPIKTQENLPNTEIPGSYPWPFQINQSVHHRRALRLDGQTVKQGIGVHSDSRLTWKLPQGILELSGACGLDAEAQGKGSVHFRIWGDGKRLFDSGLLQGSDAAKRFRISLKSIKELTLEVVTDPDQEEEKNFTLDRAVWADLILLTI